MEDKILQAIIKDIFDKGGGFDIREVSLNDEFHPSDLYEYFDSDIQRHYSIQLLSRIKEGISSEEISSEMAEGIIKDIIKNPDNIYEQEHVFSNLTSYYNARIYLNPAIGEGYYKFIEEFIIRALRSNIRFDMKPSNALGVPECKDGMVIYTTTNYLEQASNICLGIFRDFPELQKQFGTPPYGTITPNSYFGVCQNVTLSKFGLSTYNTYFNGVAMQSFIHLILSDNPQIKDNMIKDLGKEVVEDFMNFKTHYKIKGLNSDVVSSYFFKQPKFLAQLKLCYGNKLDSLTSDFYKRMQMFHSVYIYGDTKHPSHPAIVDDIRFLEKYVKGDSLVSENIDILTPQITNDIGISNGFRPAGDLESVLPRHDNSWLKPAGDLTTEEKRR